MKKLLVAFSLCLLCSCSAHLYNASNHNVSETQVVLDKANFTVIGTVSGSAKASYILGIGGLSQKSLKGNAVTEMYENANLTGSQAIINVVFKQRVSNVLIYSEIEYTASGTIIEFFDGARPVVSPKTVDVKEDDSDEYAAPDAITVAEEPIQNEFIVSKRDTDGTWYDAIEYCKALGDEWALPNMEQVEYIIDNCGIKFSSCWTNVAVNENKAKAYYRGNSFPMSTTHKFRNNISIIAVKVADKEVE